MAQTPVDIVLSLGEPRAVVPDLKGMTRDEAEAALLPAQLDLGVVTEEYVDIQPAGRVFRQSPAAGVLTAFQSTVNFTVSLGTWTGLDETAPHVEITVTPERIKIGETAVITVTAWNNVGGYPKRAENLRKRHASYQRLLHLNGIGHGICTC